MASQKTGMRNNSSYDPKKSDKGVYLSLYNQLCSNLKNEYETNISDIIYYC